MPLRPTIIVVALLTASLHGSARAQAVDSSRFTPGVLRERFVSPSAPAESYAVLLPSRYDTSLTWPVLLLMDPRGRALVPLRLVQEAAERYGYIVLSSYNTRSDEMDDPNAAAVNAMLADAQQLLAIDRHRIYLVGFSGTARAAWEYGYRLEGNVAGLLGFGAAFTSGWAPEPPLAVGAEAPLVFFGGAGVLDFNYEEVVDLDRYLDGAGVRHQVEFYPGPHSWPPRSVMDDGITWMELQAMRRGLAPRNESWIDSLYRVRTEAAHAAQAAGDAVLAYRRYRAVASDFRGLRDVTDPDRRTTALESGKPVRRALARQQQMLERYNGYSATLRQVLAELNKPTETPPLDRLIKDLSIRKLQREAADRSDSVFALSAQRLLEQVFVVSSFYWPRAALAAGEPAQALVLLDLAEVIHPGVSHVCEYRREARRLLGTGDTTASCSAPNS